MIETKFHIRLALPILVAFALNIFSANAQNVGIKTNLLYDAFASANLAVEVGLAPKWTLEISADYMPWKTYFDSTRKHLFVQPEARYWFCDRFSGHFLGIHAHSGIYNVSGSGISGGKSILGVDFSALDKYRYHGWFVGGGISYGYAFILSKHLNLDLEIGAGYAYTCSDKFECAECGSKIASRVPFHYFGPTKAAVNFVILF